MLHTKGMWFSRSTRARGYRVSIVGPDAEQISRSIREQE
jgi:hypothetical protein